MRLIGDSYWTRREREKEKKRVQHTHTHKQIYYIVLINKENAANDQSNRINFGSHKHRPISICVYMLMISIKTINNLFDIIIYFDQRAMAKKRPKATQKHQLTHSQLVCIAHVDLFIGVVVVFLSPIFRRNWLIKFLLLI